MPISKQYSLIRVLVAYVTALAVGVLAGLLVSSRHPIWIAAIADVAATVVVFAFSMGWRNSSTYDPYWSVAPPVIAVYWAASAVTGEIMATRQLIVLVLVILWGARLTWNWVLRWRGLADEDWRYTDLQRQHGSRYWIVSFSGIHMLPTVLVFAGCLPLFPALADATQPPGWPDAVAGLVTLGAVWIEGRADKQLRRFRASDKRDGILDHGIWAYSRHPNYFGEVMFWWGLYLFGLAANPAYWWTGIGALAITLLFLFISIPMMDKRMLARRPDYASRMRAVSALIPWPRTRK